MPAPISPRPLPTQSIALTPHLDGTAGSKSHLFRPPRTPATTSLSGASSVSTDDKNSRKRPRPTSSHNENEFATPYSAQRTNWSHGSGESLITRPVAAGSPPLINTRYALAGGLDTPTLNAAALDEQRDGTSMGVNCSRSWNTATDDPWNRRTDYFAPPLPLARERNGRARRNPTQDVRQPGWGNFMFTIVGGVAGKMWDFCTAGAFRGFHAGGGKGYDVSSPTSPISSAVDNWQDINTQEQPRQFERDATPIPGQFPIDELGDKSIPYDNTPPRPSKRIHTETGTGWVMVSHNTHSGDASPQLSSGRSLASSLLPTYPIARRHSGMRAANRKSLIPVSRRTSNISHGGSPSVNSQKRHSLATSRPSSSHGISLSPEAQRYAERVAREDREAERSMRKLNTQLKAMIKEGKQALGTKFEVENEQLEDEGYSEDL